jgi:hypothetical protein
MKNLTKKLSCAIHILLSTVLMIGCGVPSPDEREAKIQKDLAGKYNVLIIDSCEYILLSKYRKGFMAHKGNCKYCELRN